MAYSVNKLTQVNSEEAQTRITCAPRVVMCFDKLKVGLNVFWRNPAFLDRLEVIKQKAQEGENDSIPVEIEGFNFNCMRTGTSRYTYRLISGDISVLLNRRKHNDRTPNVRIEIGSISCWSPGYKKLYSDLKKILSIFSGSIVKEIVSEVHLAVDLLNVDINSLPISDQDHWISRAHKFTSNYDHKKFTGITQGKGNLMLRIYDKIMELQNQNNKQKAFKDIWRLKSLENAAVTRIEFQVRRPVLREFKPSINTLENLENTLTSLWQYLSLEWSQLTLNPVDRNHNQSRAVIHPLWEFIQSLEWDGDTIVKRSKVYSLKDELRLRKLFAGVGKSISVLYECKPDDIEKIINTTQGIIENDIREQFSENPSEFIQNMQRKINDNKIQFIDEKILTPESGQENQT
ncbi:MAG: hypothetical protein KKE17_05560 [Proteobacteria bacterium]|nr:hypothetical protein [Pseudomonadota bacterium]MBU1709458.1 hypothetical protein [Pseudomonadota bacterium]